MKFIRGFSGAALALALVLPGAAAAQDFSDAMDAALAQRPVDPALPGDDQLSCEQIRAEAKERNQEIANLMGGTVKMADNQMKAQETERKAKIAAETARDVANSLAPAGLAPGNAIEAAADKAIGAARMAREAKTVAQVAVMSGNVQFIAQRIPHLHQLYAAKCAAGGAAE